MTRILIASTSRADITALAAVVKACMERPSLDVDVLLTGRHVLAGADRGAAEAQLPPGCPIHIAGADLGGAGAEKVSEAMGDIVTGVGRLFARSEPDMLVVLGDRLDMVPIVLASLPFNVPVAHLHGGELTYGAVDDRIRHAVTKLSHLHFASNAHAAARICDMGEEPWRVHVTGAPALDALLRVEDVGREAFLREIELPKGSRFILATVHPETNAKAPLSSMKAVLSAAQEIEIPVLFTAANADMGGAEINECLTSASETNRRFRFIDTLGLRRFANALRHADIMLGNSSSGIVEAGAFGLPVVNVGKRQEGRWRGRNVVDVEPDKDAVVAAIHAQLGKRFALEDVSVYGDGSASERISRIIEQCTLDARLLTKFQFDGAHEFVSPWATNGPHEPVSPHSSLITQKHRALPSQS